MGKALYRKYRSKSLDEIVGQKHITETLGNAIKSGHISHAYLFTGPRGTGKTSIARIVAHSVNNLPYNADVTDNYVDIIEIDAASNRRIDEIRDLREKAMIAPTSSKYKVYIIDEAHMLTREAFNALLKTLEEPPSHVIFILATTEIHKLPKTIISRTQHFNFNPIPESDLINHLENIAKKEKINIDKSALELIAKHGRGSFRDSISLLDQLGSSGNKITVDTIQRAIGSAPTTIIQSIIHDISVNNLAGILGTIDQISKQSLDPTVIADSLIEKMRDSIRKGDNQIQKNKLFWLLNELLTVQKSADPSIRLELILLEATWLDDNNKDTPIISIKKQPEKQSKQSNEADFQVMEKSKISNKKSDNELDLWDSVISDLKGKYNSLYGVARMAEANIDGKTITLSFKHDFHKRRCSEPRNKTIISDTINKISKNDYALNFVTNPSIVTKEPEKESVTKSSDTLETITKVFGGGEVLDE